MASLSSIMITKGLAVQTTTTGGGGGSGGGGGGSGGTVVVSGSAVTIDTVAELNASVISDGVNYIRTAGFYVVGDQGAGAWRRKALGEVDVPGDQTSNGGAVKWEIIVENSRLKFHQFGPKSMPQYNVQPAAGSDGDSYRHIVMADRFIAQKFWRGITLDMGDDLFYWSKAHNMKRCAYKIQGCTGNQGTMIRSPAYEDTIMINYQYGNGHDYALYMNNWGYASGTALWKQTSQTGAGNVYRCVVSGTSAVTGDTLNGNNPSATYTDGAAQFKFERYIGPNGTDPYDYYLGADTAATTSEIADMQFWSFWDKNSSDPNVNKWPDQHGYVKPATDWGTMVGLYNCAIVERVRAKLTNIFAFQYAGFGIGIAADGDPCLTGPGNVNGFHNDHMFLYWHGKAGLHVGYADANAGLSNYLDTSFCGRFGYEEWSFLGNMMTMHQSAFDGSMQLANKQYPSGVLYNGYGWLARLPILGIDGWPAYINETPGGSNNAWIKYGGDGTLTTGVWGQNYPDWSPTQRYEPGGGFSSNNVNARNVFLSMYIEGGTFVSQPSANTVVLMGLLQEIDYSRGALVLANNSWSFISTDHIDMGNMSFGTTVGAPTGQGGSHELRFERTGGTGTSWAYEFYNSAWIPVGGNRT